MFFGSVFFAPIFASIPSWATGGALVIVGSLMIRNVREINWNYIGDSVPAFLTIIITPLTYNIAYGVIAGATSYILLNSVAWVLRKVSNGRISPPAYDAAEPWVVPPGGIAPPWIKKFTRRSNATGPVLNNDLQMRPTQKGSYVDLQGVISRADHEESFSEHKARVSD